MKEVDLNSWKEFKEICIDKKKLKVQYTEDDSTYIIFAIDGPVVWNVTCMAKSKEGKDFSKNFKKDANKPLKD